MKKKTDKLDFLKIRNFSTKDTVKQIKRQVTAGIRYLQKTYEIKDLYPKYTQNSYNSKVRKQSN